MRKVGELGKVSRRSCDDEEVVQNIVMNEELIPNGLMDKKIVKNFVMGAKIDPKVVMDLSQIQNWWVEYFATQ